jgi:fructose 5-dehydrogenase cytochrome subunit
MMGNPRAASRFQHWRRLIPAAALWLLSFSGDVAAATIYPAETVERGRYLAVAGDCTGCHTNPRSGAPFAGGYGIASPLGVIYSSNITPSHSAGIGGYTETQFAHALREGVRADGTHLYPAMPYTAYTRLSDDDVQALFAYFQQAVAPVDVRAPKTHLPFPFNLRFAMVLWNALFLKDTRYEPDPSKSAEWNRGAYVVTALEHCGACHTPRNLLMAEKTGRAFAGAPVEPWYAPNITPDPISGIGGWSHQEIVRYLKTGAVYPKSEAAGGMAEAVSDSLQYLYPRDLDAIATYLETIPAIRADTDTRAAFAYGGPADFESTVRGADTGQGSLTSGAALYSGYCASCHQPTGAGTSGQAFPVLFHNTVTGANRADNLISTILNGIDREAGGRRAVMPRFDDKSYIQPLTDEQISAVSNYVSRTFGNPAVRVSVKDVAAVRKSR